MRLSRTVIVMCVVFGSLVVFVTAALAQSGKTPNPDQSVATSIRGNFDYGRAAAFDGYGLFASGDSFSGVPLVAVTRRRDNPNPRLPVTAKPSRANWVSFIYASDCVYDEFGIACANMAQVQVWPVCERNLSVYVRARQEGDVRIEMTTVRGVPAALFEGESMLEIYSGDSTIVLFARDKAQLLELASELSSVNAFALDRPGVGREQALPQPAAGAMDGTMACSVRT